MVTATLAKTAFQTIKNVDLHQISKMGEVLYPILRLRETILLEARDEEGNISRYQGGGLLEGRNPAHSKRRFINMVACAFTASGLSKR